MKLLRIMALLAGVLAGSAAAAQQPDKVIKIGVLNDMSGLYADISGPGLLWPRAWRSRTSTPHKRD